MAEQPTETETLPYRVTVTAPNGYTETIIIHYKEWKGEEWQKHVVGAIMKQLTDIAYWECEIEYVREEG